MEPLSTRPGVKFKQCRYLADTTLLRSLKFAFTEAVSTYSDGTTGSLLPKATQKPSKLQNCPRPCGFSRGCLRRLATFTWPNRCCLMRDWTTGWEERSNWVRKLRQKPWEMYSHEMSAHNVSKSLLISLMHCVRICYSNQIWQQIVKSSRMTNKTPRFRF